MISLDEVTAALLTFRFFKVLLQRGARSPELIYFITRNEKKDYIGIHPHGRFQYSPLVHRVCLYVCARINMQVAKIMEMDNEES